MNLEKDTAPTGLYNYLPKSQRRTAWQKKTGRRGIGTLKEGLLKKVGYSASASVTRRHAAVKRAVKKYGRTSTIRKLNAVAVYTRKRAPKTSRKFKADMKFAQKMRGGATKEELETFLAEVEAAQSADGEKKENDDKIPSEIVARPEFIKRARKLGVTTEKWTGDTMKEGTTNYGDLINAIGQAIDLLST